MMTQHRCFRYRVSTADRTWTAESQRLGIDNGWTSELARPPPLDSLREHAQDSQPAPF